MDYEKSYNERLECGSKAIYNRLKDLYPNENDFEKALHDLSEALTAYEKVYIEIGLKAGACIIFEFLKNI